MPRCLCLHKVPPTAGFCAVCGARVLPDWVWLCLCALPLALIYAAVVSSPAAKRPDAAPPPIVVTRIIIATVRMPTPTHTPLKVTPSPTWTPTPRPSPTASPTPTATLFPRLALLSYHDLYVIAKGEADGWVLKQEPKLEDLCAWFTVIPQDKGRVALLTCYNRYITSPRTGIADRRDWVLRQETMLVDDCGKFAAHDLGNGKFAFETCAERYITAGDNSWGDLSWLMIAQAEQVQDWERFTPQRP